MIRRPMIFDVIVTIIFGVIVRVCYIDILCIIVIITY